MSIYIRSQKKQLMAKAAPAESPDNSRFIEKSDLPNKVRLPDQYLNEPLVSLEESLNGLLARIKYLDWAIEEANKKCYHENPHGLSYDEAAAIYIYTMEWGGYALWHRYHLYETFNADLRSKDSSRIKVWFRYLKLLVTALDKIPSIEITVYRGINRDFGKLYAKDTKFIWGSLTSCTRSKEKASEFAGNSSGTVFAISTKKGKDIAEYSMYKTEKEVLLYPGTEYRVVQGPTLERIRNQQNYFIHLEDNSVNSWILTKIINLFA
jgi:hypothetical protein